MNTKSWLLSIFVAMAICLFWGSNKASAVTIGIWDIQSAPVSANMLSGSQSGYFNAWLNIANVPITPNEALSGESILDDGIANLTSNALFQLNFAPNTSLNISGTDLVLFDARYDAGSYAVSTSYDGFAAELTLPVSAFLSTGEMRDYFLEGYPTPTTFPAEIYGAPIDLSLLGVPIGVGVSGIRVRSLNADGADFIGVGSLTAATVPEPATLLLLGSGLAGIAVWRKRLGRKEG